MESLGREGPGIRALALPHPSQWAQDCCWMRARRVSMIRRFISIQLSFIPSSACLVP